ncbi:MULTISPECIES: histidinol-phosphate transaminase [unclassified Oceanispirochaeta]|uniref:histidinol-phosphate transaminase n=1 Tax=unclassified Oceanispirochaeta TaxID=2635722 RepID=UPI000E09353B|nr:MULTISPECIES: histidinol-phosphate transaminase [unclassified Oceanispirochaeta]MBF9016637.1 histidinol-phosphate transaminase [Oceanispirochaeta sp. M2]NPD73158.1 histidinol-phosphate transaminase [Oceanispirochaeta sp. M1]RDG31255.1 histidinol-phosphate transaminase [Oceanispirochaeta sp. M1]
MKIRKTLQSVTPYVAGKSKAGAVKLSSNENPLGPSPRALAAINREMNHLHRYPDGRSSVLIEALAEHFDLKKECFIAGNGSDEIFALIAGTYLEEGQEVVTADSTFSEYNFSGLLFGGHVKKVPLIEGKFDPQGLLNAVTDKTSLVFIANPNNPTGTFLDCSEIRSFMEKLPKSVILVLDEAYAEFSTHKDFCSGRDMVMEYPNLIVTRTFSKIYGLAGLRLGFAMGHPDIIQEIFRSKQAFNVNLLAQKAGAEALKDDEFIERTLKLCREGREYLYKALEEEGFFYYPSEANFICIRINKDSKEVFDSFLDQGMAIRPLSSFGMNDWIRYTIGTVEHNREFIRLLKTLKD